MKLLEVFVQGNKKPKTQDTIIGYKAWVWVIDDKNFDTLSKDIFIKMKVPRNDQEIIDSQFELARYIKDDYPQAVVGTIDTFGDLNIDADNYRPSTDSSTLKKLMSVLKIQDVKINYFNENDMDDDIFQEDRAEFFKPLKKKTFLHGTSYYAWQRGIHKTGIRPMSGSTNFDKIRHDDKIFLTLNKEKSLFHADTAMRNTDTAGLILEIRLPDVSKLVTDYDVALTNFGKDHPNTIALGYSDIDEYARNGFDGFANSDHVRPDLMDIRSSGKDTLSSKLGIFGYIGRIPVKFIEGVWVDRDALTSTLFNDLFGNEEELSHRSLSNWDFFTVKQFNSLSNEITDELEEEMSEEEEY